MTWTYKQISKINEILKLTNLISHKSFGFHNTNWIITRRNPENELHMAHATFHSTDIIRYSSGFHSKFSTKAMYVSSTHVDMHDTKYQYVVSYRRTLSGRSWHICSLISADIYQLLQRKVLRFHSLHLIQRNLKCTIRSLHAEEDHISTGSFTSLYFSNYLWMIVLKYICSFESKQVHSQIVKVEDFILTSLCWPLRTIHCHRFCLVSLRCRLYPSSLY